MKHSNTSSDTPLISCLMVTANRTRLARRAVSCYQKQTYPHKELLIVDDGAEDYEPIIRDLPSDEVTYIKLEKKDRVLGELRNLSLDHAQGDFLAQWDDDDWYHPERLQLQANELMAGNDSCYLTASLMHIDEPDFFDMPYVGFLPKGIPGTIMHRRDDAIRYPAMRRSEDTIYQEQWLKKNYSKLDEHHAGLFIRCFHGSNTWERTHFKRRMRNSIPKLFRYAYYKFVKQDLKQHPLFRLSPKVADAFQMYLEHSRDLNIFQSDSGLP